MSHFLHRLKYHTFSAAFPLFMAVVLTGSVAYFVTSLTREQNEYITIMVGLFYLWAFLIVLNGFWTDYRKEQRAQNEDNKGKQDETLPEAA